MAITKQAHWQYREISNQERDRDKASSGDESLAKTINSEWSKNDE